MVMPEKPAFNESDESNHRTPKSVLPFYVVLWSATIGFAALVLGDLLGCTVHYLEV